MFAGIGLFIYSSFNSEFQNATSVAASVRTDADNYNNTFTTVMDGGIILWFVILWLGSIVTALFLDNSPVWFVIFFLISLMSFFALLPFANIQSDLSETALSLGYSHLPMTMYIHNHLIIFLAAFIVSIGIALYAKKRYMDA